MGERPGQQTPADSPPSLQGGFAEILNTLPDAVVSIDENQRIIFFNRGAEHIFGYASADVIGRPIEILIPDHKHHVHHKHVHEFITTHAPPRYKHARGGIYGVRANGETFPAEASISTITIDGRLVVTAVLRDIGNLMAAEAKLRIQAVAMEQAGEAILITDRDGVIQYVNKAFSIMTGYSEQDAVGKKAALVRISEQDPHAYDELWQTILSGKVWSGSFTDKRKDGTSLASMLSIAPIINDDGFTTHYVGIQTDLSEQQRLERELIQAQKMEVVGTLVSGIAHDFNNILSAILANVYLTKKSSDSSEALLKRMDSVEKLGYRGAEMIRQLLTFSRTDLMEATALSIAPAIREAVGLARTGVPESIGFETDICSGDLYVHANQTQLQQMVMNLVTNACHALADRPAPKITVSLQQTDYDGSETPLHGKACVCLSFSDNGCGIPPDIIEKIFDPFFTTKGVGDGTGLGLSMVYGSVKAHGGHIEVSSGEKGTTFNIFLPLTDVSAADDETIAPATLQGRGRCILLVDDEQDLLAINKELLESMGFRVLTAVNGEDAIAVFHAHCDAIDLVMTDIVMPLMSGIEAAEVMRNIRGDIPILFVTGYDESFAMGRAQVPEHSLLMRKPFSMDRMAQVIGELLHP